MNNQEELIIFLGEQLLKYKKKYRKILHEYNELEYRNKTSLKIQNEIKEEKKEYNNFGDDATKFFINKPEQNLKIFYIIIKIFCGNQRPDPNPSFFILINMRPKHFFDKDGAGYAHLYWITSTIF